MVTTTVPQFFYLTLVSLVNSSVCSVHKFVKIEIPNVGPVVALKSIGRVTTTKVSTWIQVGIWNPKDV